MSDLGAAPSDDPLAVAAGGTGAESASAARTNLELLARKNKCTNPRFLIGTTGWTNVSLTTFAQTASLPAAHPVSDITTGLSCVSDAAGDGATFDLAVINGLAYRVSLYVYISAISSGTIRLRVVDAGAVNIATDTDSTTGQWIRQDVSFTANATATWTVRTDKSGGTTATWTMSGVLIERGSTLRNYFDGESTGGIWLGAENGSEAATAYMT